LRWVVVGLSVLAFASACMPPETTIGPTPPKIVSFVASGSPFSAPALVPLSWKVSDANGDVLTCRLDREDDGIYDETIQHCGRQSRDVALGEGSHAARLEVTDGTATVTKFVLFEVGAGPTESFSITLRPLSPLDPDVSAAFGDAAARWEAAITRGVPDALVELDPHECFADEPGITTSVDDVLVTVEVAAIDGPGGILGQAGPCLTAPVDSLTRAGLMRFDAADVAELLDEGTFTSVVLHEMGHVLGIGTLWDTGRDLTGGTGSSNPIYTGPRGVAEWSVLGGADSLPVEALGGPGTAGAHWRESVFADELMTGWIASGPNPLSAMTVASLGDLGYHVDPSTADPYALPIPGVRGRPAAAPVDLSGMLPTPISSL
jgi:hypothetical protein